MPDLSSDDVTDDYAAYLVSKLPFVALGKILSYLPLKDLSACSLVCRHWHTFLSHENNNLWARLCHKLVPQSALADSCLFSDLTTCKSKLRSYFFAWNPSDCSRNGYIKANGFTFHRNPVAQSTDGVRAKRGFRSGRHSWDVWWQGPLGTVAVMGVVSRHAALQCPGYSPLLGSDDQGWGWNLVDGQLVHDGKTLGTFPVQSDAPKYAGEKIRLVLDCDEHTLYFERGCEFLGVAFRNLPPIRLFPCVTSVYGNTEVTMVYLGPPLDG